MRRLGDALAQDAANRLAQSSACTDCGLPTMPVVETVGAPATRPMCACAKSAWLQSKPKCHVCKGSGTLAFRADGSPRRCYGCGGSGWAKVA